MEGKIRLGTYAVIDQVMTKFLVLDLDKKSFVEDARAIHAVSQKLQLTPLFEISKSGNGIHIWYFFDTLVRAVDVRRLGDLILTRAMDISSGIDMKSYDRMFPNQDFVAPDALGNLIALPLHYGSRSENKTVGNSKFFLRADRFVSLSPKGAALSSILGVRFFRIRYGESFKNLP